MSGGESSEVDGAVSAPAARIVPGAGPDCAGPGALQRQVHDGRGLISVAAHGFRSRYPAVVGSTVPPQLISGSIAKAGLGLKLP